MFYFLKEPKADKDTPINLMYWVKSENKRFKMSTGLSIHPDDWDFTSRLPKKKRGQEGVKLRRITANLVALNNRLEEILHDYKNPSLSDLKKEFNPGYKKLEYVVDLYCEFLDFKHKVGLTRSTLKSYKTMFYILEDFSIEQNLNFKLADLTAEFYVDLIDYLRGVKNQSDNTINKNLKTLKAFLNYLQLQGHKVSDDFRSVNVSSYTSDQIALTFEEVQKLEGAKFEGALDRARDLFLVGVYSGQRFSDYSRLSKDSLQDGIFIVRQTKTKTNVQIPLTKPLETILNKYEWQLPQISSQKFNKRIQEACKILGFNENFTRWRFRGNKKEKEIFKRWSVVTSHTARRTFITLSLERGLSNHFIMSITGHKDLRVMSAYAKVNKEALKKAAAEIFVLK